MKNIFDFATKELSQDAFLRWLFENYDCKECPAIRETCRRLFDSFTDKTLDFDKIKNLRTVAQWKNIDVAVWFEINNETYLIVIEDKTGSGEHDHQLERYMREIETHNQWWREHVHKQKNPERYAERDDHVFHIFFKTDIVGAERKYIETLGWKVYDIFAIFELLGNIHAENELLCAYAAHIHNLYVSARHEGAPSRWDLIAWHSFFVDYANGLGSPDSCGVVTDIDHYQSSYYYIKFLLKDHASDRPAFEIRSRHYDACAHSWRVLINLYCVVPQPTQAQINDWQKALTDAGIQLNYRRDPSNQKQIGHYVLPIEEDTEAALRKALDSAVTRLIAIYGKD